MFNDTLSRLSEAFEQLRRFTADASHELRTPLTAMRSVGEVALRWPDRVARWAVEANGGRIEIESEDGHGSLFRIVLPVHADS